MAAYRRVYDSRHLQADCKEPGSAAEPYARKSSTSHLYLDREAEYCDDRVCLCVRLCVCMSVREHISRNTRPIFTKVLLRPPIGERSIATGVSVCLSLCVCLSTTISSELHVRSATNSFCVLPMAVARSFSDGAVIRYVLPVIWMTSYLSYLFISQC